MKTEKQTSMHIYGREFPRSRAFVKRIGNESRRAYISPRPLSSRIETHLDPCADRKFPIIHEDMGGPDEDELR
jgi:hypothetical protein